MFEFSRFWPSDYEHGRDFVADLDKFLRRAAEGLALRGGNAEPALARAGILSAASARHGVTHVFNSWDAMPSVSEQMAIPGSRTNPALTAARFLLKPGRKYEEAVKTFEPYDRVKEPNDDARAAGAKLIADGRAAKKKQTFIYVNNRLEGNALETIAAMVAYSLVSTERHG